MATKKEQQHLIDILKFTPRTYKVHLWGYGGEKVMGTTDQAVWDYCMANQVDLSEIAWNSDAAEDMKLDAAMLPFPPGSWYECDNLAHVSGVSRDAGTLQIEDENGNIIFEKSLSDIDGSDGHPQWHEDDEIYVSMCKPGDIVFVGSSTEKGTFFEGEIDLTAPFDIEKLQLSYEDVDGESIINSVSYDGEDIENDGGSTSGKSSDFDMFRLQDNQGNLEKYAPEEKDWGHPEYGISPSSWESSPTFKFKKHKPVYPGYYNATWSHFGTTYGSAYWNGEQFGEWVYGQFKPINEVVSWSGYNWNTSDWANQPPAPPDQSCDNKNCGWVGHSTDRITDDDYNDFCPECNGTEFTWIDYDPDTSTGRANSKKYAKTNIKE